MGCGSRSAPEPVAAKRIVVISEAARNAYAGLRLLRESGFEVVERYDIARATQSATVTQTLETAWGVIAGGIEPYSSEVFDHTPDLRVIARFGVGYDRIDVEAATSRRIAVFITPGTNDESVADFTLTLMLACLQRLMLVNDTVRLGGWRPPGLSRELSRATVGIIGLGRIGRAVARRLSGFECRVMAVEPFPDFDFCRQWNVDLMSLDTMLPVVDVLTIHAALSSATRHLIGRSELAQMKVGAIIINTARGGLVEEAALVDALEIGRVAAAGLDVFEREPLSKDHPFRSMSNVLLSGHVASLSRGAVESTAQAVASGLLAVSNGKVPSGCLNPEVFV
jgi:D-3-phosphoglycerate dehydrogenase / 2-oxoglutarate reductase